MGNFERIADLRQQEDSERSSEETRRFRAPGRTFVVFNLAPETTRTLKLSLVGSSEFSCDWIRVLNSLLIASVKSIFQLRRPQEVSPTEEEEEEMAAGGEQSEIKCSEEELSSGGNINRSALRCWFDDWKMLTDTSKSPRSVPPYKHKNPNVRGYLEVSFYVAFVHF